MNAVERLWRLLTGPSPIPGQLWVVDGLGVCTIRAVDEWGRVSLVLPSGEAVDDIGWNVFRMSSEPFQMTGEELVTRPDPGRDDVDLRRYVERHVDAAGSMWDRLGKRVDEVGDGVAELLARVDDLEIEREDLARRLRELEG